ncbi:acyl-CoA thioesterase [Dethiosulfatarculus sandiegensis]|nr:thioesterase family protein [Dethiosulfatarculus sandiegensis]
MMNRYEFRPLFGDTDAMNVVYYGNYLRYFERGRAELMRAGGGAYADLAAQGLHLPVTEAHVRYQSPARYDDPLVVSTKVAWVKRASLRFDYLITRKTSAAGEETLVSGYTVHGCVSTEGKISPLPNWLVDVARAYVSESAG